MPQKQQIRLGNAARADLLFREIMDAPRRDATHH
jgi:hypothetical protein